MRFIPENERLYTGAHLIIESDTTIRHEKQLKKELETVMHPEPNSKLLGAYAGLYYHYKNQKKKPGFFARWMYKRMGEAPVYQSDVETYEVEKLLLNRLENRGFFYSSAVSEFNESRKKAAVTYTVHVPKPYRLKTYNLDSLPTPIHGEISELLALSPITTNHRFDLNTMKLERLRIDSELKKRGYYNFNENFLVFEADTNRYDNKKFDLFLKLKQDVPKKSILPYKITKINVYPNYKTNDSVVLSSTRYDHKNFIQSETFFKPKYLAPFIKLKEGDFYNPETSRHTARRLSTIGAYKYVNILYSEIDSLATDSLGVLEANIYLSPLNKRSFRAELQVVTKSNNYTGPTLALTYSNRNLFGGGEVYNTTLRLGYEAQINNGKSTGRHSLELGLKNELIFPRVLFPIKIKDDFFKYSIPKTKTAVSLDYLERTKLYSIVSGAAQFGYVWDANRFVIHQITPISITYTRLEKTSAAFKDILDNNPFLKRSFDQQFIAGLTYSFTYNEQVDAHRTHQKYLNLSLDLAGNTISLLSRQQGQTKTFLGADYAQFAKVDLDLHYHFNFGKAQSIATRLYAGYGMAYGNSEVIPFVKQYYAGGPYSVRAFRIRSLGPGTYNADDDSNNTPIEYFDKTGNIRLEANIEYRFPIVSFLKGAVFADAGNIWNSKANPIFGGKDKFSKHFIDELGMGAGAGLRIDVQGFVIRFDVAAPFHNPSLPRHQRFNFDLKNTILNFAIGYPF